jgi:membrane peptidoglycan carboxypeptidase
MKNTDFQSRIIGDTPPLKRRHHYRKGIRARFRSFFSWSTAWWKRPRQAKNLKKRIVYVLVGLFVLGMLSLALLWFTLPDINDPATMFPAQSTVILDRNGVELYRLFSEEDRTYVSGDRIGQFIKDATIAIEDERFISRSTCFDITAYLRAAMSQIAPRYFVRSGGSTLTQQFAGNALVGRERSILRKIRELLLACQLEQRYNKNELLELYLNWIPYGQNAYGIEQASKKYFSISAKDLSLAQSAVLASLPQRPSYFNPYGAHKHTTVSDVVRQQILNGAITSASAIPDGAVTVGLIGQKVGSGSVSFYIGGRTDQVLKNMLDQKRITLDAHNKALSELQKMAFAPDRKNIRAPHFVLGIQKEVEDILGIEDTILQQGGFRITTTLDWDLQSIAEKVVTKHHEDVTNRFGAHNIALVALSAKTREVLAYVGNANFDDNEHEGKIDMALSPRQPGSSFKPFTYLAAFEAGFGPGSVTYDVPTKFGSDAPSNYDGTFWGLTSMRTALASSRNIPAIKAFFLAGGEDAVLSLARRLGVGTPTKSKEFYRQTTPDFDYGWPLSIGAAETPLIEMVQGYASIADGGVYLPVTKILKITDKDGNIRFAPKAEPPQQIIDERLTAEITSILSDVNARPQNQYWRDILSVPGFAAAAKTGTSNKCLERDTNGGCTLRRPESTWTVGYTPSIIAGVWAGNATSQSLYDKADGLTTAAPIWHDFMMEANRTMEGSKTGFALPSGLSNPLISRLSGKLASLCTPLAVQSTDIFLDENVPIEEDPACVILKVDKVTGLLSSPACPSDAVEERAFFLPKSELPIRWPQWEEGVQAWAAKNMEIWRATENHSGSLLPLPLAPTELCDPSLTPGRDIKPTLRIVSPTIDEIVEYPVFRARLDIQSASPVRQIEFQIDGKTMSVYSEEPFSNRPVRVLRTLDKEGSHTLTVTVTDTYYNTAVDSVQLRFAD